MLIAPGADQVVLLDARQEMKPFLAPGTTTTHFARSIRSCGMPLAGPVVTAENISAASCSRLSGFCSAAAKVRGANVVASSETVAICFTIL